MRIKQLKNFDNVFYEDKGRRKTLLTLNYAPGNKVYGERLFKHKGKEYREWIPNRSKLGAAIMKGIKTIPIKSGSKVLYLGIASGTTGSHISDIVGRNGQVWGVDVAVRVLRDLIFVCKTRANIFPILANAGEPLLYKQYVPKVDIVYQDVAVKTQAEFLIRNAEIYLKPNGYAMIAVKARSINVAMKPSQVFSEVEQKLVKHFKIVEKTKLEPFEKDHMFYILQKK